MSSSVPISKHSTPRGFTMKVLEHANDVNDASFSPDGQWIVTASEDQSIGLWRLRR